MKGVSGFVSKHFLSKYLFGDPVFIFFALKTLSPKVFVGWYSREGGRRNVQIVWMGLYWGLICTLPICSLFKHTFSIFGNQVSISLILQKPFVSRCVFGWRSRGVLVTVWAHEIQQRHQNHPRRGRRILYSVFFSFSFFLLCILRDMRY